MTNSILRPPEEIGVSNSDYEGIARRVPGVQAMFIEERLEILAKAKNELPDRVKTQMRCLIMYIANDDNFYKIARLDPKDGPPIGEKIFTTAVASYFLEKQRSIESKPN
jgi:hypothetical protein